MLLRRRGNTLPVDPTHCTASLGAPPPNTPEIVCSRLVWRLTHGTTHHGIAPSERTLRRRRALRANTRSPRYSSRGHVSVDVPLEKGHARVHRAARHRRDLRHAGGSGQGEQTGGHADVRRRDAAVADPRVARVGVLVHVAEAVAGQRQRVHARSPRGAFRRRVRAAREGSACTRRARGTPRSPRREADGEVPARQRPRIPR